MTMAAAVEQRGIQEHFSSVDKDPKDVEDGLAHGTSVLLTPDSTPTKESPSRSPATSPEPTVPPLILRIPHSATQGNKALLSRSQSDSQLDSPKPTRCKLTRSELQSKRVLEDASQSMTSSQSTAAKPPTGVRGKGRTGRSRKTANKTKISTNNNESKSSQTANTKGAAKATSSRSRSVPGHRNSMESNTLVTDYFPVRRSSRVPSKHLKRQQTEELEKLILSGSEDGLEVVEIEGKGRGVVSTKPFGRGDFVVEYRGDLTTVAIAKKREENYSKDSDLGCYMYYFTFRNKSYCLDATAESPYLGRLLNHCKSNGNCMTKVVGVNDEPYLILVASRDISVGEELLYDYGDRSKEAIEAHPWLAL